VEGITDKFIGESELIKDDLSILTKADFGMLRSLINSGITHYDLSLITDLMNKGHNIFVIKYVLNKNYEMKEVSSFQIYALLNDISEIIKIHPPLDELEKAFFPEVLFIISTDKNEKSVRDKTNLTDMVETLSILKMTIDTVKSLDQMEGRKTAVEPAGEKAAEGSEIAEADIQKRNITTLRVESWKIDELLNLLGELVIIKAAFNQLDSEFEAVGTDIKFTLREFLNGVMKLNLTGEGEAVKDKNVTLGAALNKLFNSFDLYSDSMQKINRILTSLQENVMNMRMVPVQMVFSRFPRLIRDMADRMSKKVDLIVEGVETEIDKGMVDDIFDPLIHILRNSIDHGIETPEERIKAGKPETGKMVLKANHEGDSIIIELRDDGKGIDIEAIKQKAIENGMIKAENAARLTQKELLGLIFIPGLSTAKIVTDMSGRGVGMDVVKRKIEEIGGSVGVSTSRGKGTRIQIRLPLTLAIIQGLLVIVHNMHYVIPVASVEETVIIKYSDLRVINGKQTFELRGKFIPVMSLERYFYHTDLTPDSQGKVFCIVSKYGENLVGILVEEVIGEQDIVIKSLNTKLIKSPGISAATIIGNGEIGYIIETAQIVIQNVRTS
jgi:two-component system chemotaxis sensor kinase CheA